VVLDQLREVCLRPLQAEDISQVAEIEREAFSPLWVGAPFQRDLNNRNARYLVACCPQAPEDSAQPFQGTAQPVIQEPAAGGQLTEPSLLDRVINSLGRLNRRGQPATTLTSFVAGYVSTWFQGDEAHITEIAVRKTLRGNGIGELLLIGSVQAAAERGSVVVTLEVRVSNFIAQRLYEKYGFKAVGRRKAYYHDNREDAVIMTTSPIHSTEYQQKFQELQKAYRARWREILIDA
jgi:ribosomal-protein-alanine N-acetyltransferase